MSEDRITLDRENLEKLIETGRIGVVAWLREEMKITTDAQAYRDYGLMVEGAELVLDSFGDIAKLMPSGVLVAPESVLNLIKEAKNV